MNKMNVLPKLVLATIFCAVFTFAQTHSYKPKNGFIPDAKTATRVAEAVLSAIYGEEQVNSERPFTANLKGDVWSVTGSLPEGSEGGVAEVKLSKRTGQILSVSHGK